MFGTLFSQRERSPVAQPFPYTVKINKRARVLRITVKSDGGVMVTVPSARWLPRVDRFVHEKSAWIEKSVKKMKEKVRSHGGVVVKPHTQAEIKKYKEQALRLLDDKLVTLNEMYNFTYGKVTVRNQKTRWGSCSKKGNLNFNYKIILLPERLVDYIIVHELCHLGEFNHSKKFWELVERSVPNYKQLRGELQKGGIEL